MLIAKYFLPALRLQQDAKFKFFDNFPEYLSSEITEYLEVVEQINFGMTCRTLHRASNMTRDFETRKMIKRYGIEEKYDFGKKLNDEEIMRELRTFTSMVSELFEQDQFYLPDDDFLEAVKVAHMLRHNLYFPKLTLATVKAKYATAGSFCLVRRILNNPEKYKETLKYLALEHYKCGRDQLISRIRENYSGLQEYTFKRLRNYNHDARYNIIMRGGLTIYTM